MNAVQEKRKKAEAKEAEKQEKERQLEMLKEQVATKHYSGTCANSHLIWQVTLYMPASRIIHPLTQS